MTQDFDGWTSEEIRNWVLEQLNSALINISYNSPENEHLVNRIRELISLLINIY